jgi:hypothetical protein
MWRWSASPHQPPFHQVGSVSPATIGDTHMRGGLTYDTAAEAEADRTQQQQLLTALEATDRALAVMSVGPGPSSDPAAASSPGATAGAGRCGLAADREGTGRRPRTGSSSARSARTGTTRGSCGCMCSRRRSRPPRSATRSASASASSWLLKPWKSCELGLPAGMLVSLSLSGTSSARTPFN